MAVRRSVLGSLALALAVCAGPAAAQAWTYSVLKSFDPPPPPAAPGNDGSYPRLRLVPVSGGAFLGGADTGGLPGAAYPSGSGTVFTITPAGAFTRLYAFDPATEGNTGLALGPLSPGPPPTTALWGVIGSGGAHGLGGIVTFDPAAPPSSRFRVVFSFSGTDGAGAAGGLALGSDGRFYGTTAYGGGFNRGTAFRFDPATLRADGTGFESLHAFTFDEGYYANGDLVETTPGVFWGTAFDGGANAKGSIFRLDTTATPPALEVAFSFTGGADGYYPAAGLVAWGAGLYGTASAGGSQAKGTVFRFDPIAKTMTWTLSFTGTGAVPGAVPSARLLVDAGGTALYGTTLLGGGSNQGTVFTATAGGALTTLYALSGGDGQQVGEITEAPDGSLLGLAYNGRLGAGAIFRLAPPGAAAAVSGGGTICASGSAQIQAVLTGASPWSLRWSDEAAPTVYAGTPPYTVTRTVSPAATTVYTLAEFSDAAGPGAVTGSALVTFVPRLTAPVLSTAGPTTTCASGTAGTVTLAESGGGTVGHEWGYRTTPGGSITPIPGQSGASYVIDGGHFPAPGNYLLVVRSTSAECGWSEVSNEVPVTVKPSPLAPVFTKVPVVLSIGASGEAWVAFHPGSAYAWSIANGTITSGQGTSAITFRAGAAGTLTLTVVETSGGCASPQASASVTVAPAGQALLFHPVYPCRLFQTGSPVPAPPLGGAALVPGETRAIAIPAGGACGIPPTARAVALNATVLAPALDGHLAMWAAGDPQPPTSVLNFRPGRTRSNNAIVVTPAGAGSGFAVYNGSLGGVGLILDVAGYFE